MSDSEWENGAILRHLRNTLDVLGIEADRASKQMSMLEEVMRIRLDAASAADLPVTTISAEYPRKSGKAAFAREIHGKFVVDELLGRHDSESEIAPLESIEPR